MRAHGYNKTPEANEYIGNILKKCANENVDPAAGFFYYKMFDNNEIQADAPEAITYLKKSVDADCVEAVYEYGVNLATGKHVTQNDPTAKMYLTKINEYKPASTYLESHFRRNVLDFRMHEDDEISSGSVSEMTESVKSEGVDFGAAVDIFKFIMNFKSWIPLIMSIFRIIQSYSSSMSTTKESDKPGETNETVAKIKKLFDWATSLIQKIADALDLDSIHNTETSILISILFTFFFTFMIFSFNTNALTAFKLFVSCTIFIPFAFGVMWLKDLYGIILFGVGIILLALSGVVGFLIKNRIQF